MGVAKVQKVEKPEKSGYWSDYNKTCKTCINKCKQSHRATLIRCYDYKAKEIVLETPQIISEEVKVEQEHSVDVVL